MKNNHIKTQITANIHGYYKFVEGNRNALNAVYDQHQVKALKTFAGFLASATPEHDTVDGTELYAVVPQWKVDPKDPELLAKGIKLLMHDIAPQALNEGMPVPLKKLLLDEDYHGAGLAAYMGEFLENAGILKKAAMHGVSPELSSNIYDITITQKFLDLYAHEDTSGIYQNQIKEITAQLRETEKLLGTKLFGHLSDYNDEYVAAAFDLVRAQHKEITTDNFKDPTFVLQQLQTHLGAIKDSLESDSDVKIMRPPSVSRK